jgi:hypothetical protein
MVEQKRVPVFGDMEHVVSLDVLHYAMGMT